MNVKFILFIAVLAVAYSSAETVSNDRSKNLEQSTIEEQSRQKRFLLSKLLLKKAFLLGGALGFGAELLKDPR